MGTKVSPLNGLPGFLWRSLSTVVHLGYTFPGRYGTFLSLVVLLGLSSGSAPPGAVLGPASVGGGPIIPRPDPLPWGDPRWVGGCPLPLPGVHGGNGGCTGGGGGAIGPMGGRGGNGGPGQDLSSSFGGIKGGIGR